MWVRRSLWLWQKWWWQCLSDEAISVMRLEIRYVSPFGVVLLVGKLLLTVGWSACSAHLLDSIWFPESPPQRACIHFPHSLYYLLFEVKAEFPAILRPVCLSHCLPPGQHFKTAAVMRSGHFLGFLEMLLLRWWPSAADAPGQSDFLRMLHLLIFSREPPTPQLSSVEMDRQHVSA